MNEEVKATKNNISSFSMSRYIFDSILPKCTIVHGEVVSSTYLQIALNINNQDNAQQWKRNKSWISLKTISKITGYNLRTINKSVNVLKNINLIEQSYHGKLKMFQLKNNEISNVPKLEQFIKETEKILLSELSEEKVITFKIKFGQLNEKLNDLTDNDLTKLLRRTWIPDINSLRKSITNAESVYKGSSLFLLNLISYQLMFKKDVKVAEDNLLSEQDRSLMIGCSQSTLNRYISAYESAKIIERINKNGLYSIKLLSDNNNQEDKGVVNEEMAESYMCPLCKKESKSVRSFNLHLSKVNDERHKLLHKLRWDSKSSDYDVTMLIYWDNQDTFDSMIETKEEQIEEKPVETKKHGKDLYMNVPCECSISCDECFKNWNEYFSPCNRPRKTAYIEEYGENGKQEEKKQKVTPKVQSKDNAPALLKYFYDITGGKSPNWGKESKQIKNTLTHKEQPLTPDEIRIVLKYMARKGNTDIRFLSTSINEALLEHKYLQEMEVEGTNASLVKRFYNGHKMDINIQTFVRDVQRIQETINSGLSYEETKIVIDYMIETNCTVLNFIGSKRNDALLKNKSLKDTVKSMSQDINNFNNNPSFFDQDYLTIIRDELSSGRTHLKKVDQKYQGEAVRLAKEIFVNKQFTNKFTCFEWLWRIGLNPDKEIYELACRELGKQTYIDFAINSGKLKEEQKKTYEQLKLKFENWVKRQHDFFQESSRATSNN